MTHDPLERSRRAWAEVERQHKKDERARRDQQRRMASKMQRAFQKAFKQK